MALEPITRKEKIIAGENLEPITRLEKFLKEYVGSGGGGGGSGLPEVGTPYQHLVTDGEGGVKWEDRLAYEDSKLVVVSPAGAQFVKVSDEVPSWASVNSPIKYWTSDGLNSTMPPEEYFDLGNGNFATNAGYFITTDNFELSGLVLPEKGVYFLSWNSVYTTGIASADSDTPEITWDGNISVVKKIDEKFLPEPLILYVHESESGV